MIGLSQDPSSIFAQGLYEGDRSGVMLCSILLFINLIFFYIAYLFSDAGKDLENKKLYMAGRLLMYIVILISIMPMYYMINWIL